MGKIHGTINVTEVHAKGIGKCEEHNRRQYEPDKLPKNIDPSRTDLNEEWITGGKTNFKEAIDEKLEGLTVRKNAVIALEYILGASHDFFAHNPDRTKEYLKHGIEFVNARHGKENVVAINWHFDEKTPHVHVLVVPIVEKEVRWKNKKRHGKKREPRLCARDFTGHPDMLRKIQNDFYKHIVDYGEYIGVEFTKHTSAQEQVRIYNDRVNHEVAQINEQADQAKQENLILNQQLAQIQNMLAHDLALEEKIKLRKKQEEAMQRKIELNKQKVDGNEQLEKTLREKREAEKRVAVLKKINNPKGKGKDRGFKMGM